MIERKEAREVKTCCATLFKEADFSDFTVEDRRDSLLEIAKGVRHKLLGMELAIGLDKLKLGDFNVNEVKYLAQRTL